VPDVDHLSAEFQSDLVRALLQDSSFLKQNRLYITAKLFKDETESEIVFHVIEFFDRYGSTPVLTSLVQFMTSRRYDPDDVIQMAKPYYEQPVYNIEFVSSTVRDFYKKNTLRNAILDSVELIHSGKYEDVLSKIQNTVRSFNADDSIGSLFFDNTKKVLDTIDRTENVIPTGIDAVDNLLFGGPRRGTLNVVITPPNKGKSTMLVNIGKYAAIAGYHVLHYTFELDEAVINRRYFQSMVRMSKQELKTKKRTAFDLICDIAERVTSDCIIVKQYPAYSITPNDIRRHLHSVKNSRGFFPDLVLWDYADLMNASEHYDERRHELARIYYELRNVASEFNVVGWTASQTNRTGAREEIITIEDLAECYEKAAAADVLMSVNQSLEERRGHPPTARVFLAKSRDDESHVPVEILTEWNRSWIGNID